jgi:hypothetical protein
MESRESQRPDVQVGAAHQSPEALGNGRLQLRIVGTEMIEEEARQRRELSQRIVQIGPKETPCRGFSVAAGRGRRQGIDERPVWLELAPPRLGLGLERVRALILVTLDASALDAESRIEPGARQGDRVVGARIWDPGTHLGLLQVRHVTGDTATAFRLGGVEGVRLDGIGLGSVAGGALPVVEPPDQRVSELVLVGLRVRLVTAHARHGPVQVAGTAQMGALVREGLDAEVGKERIVAENRELEGVVLLERITREMPLAHHVLQGVALEAQVQRSVLGHRAQGRDPQVPVEPEASGLGQLDVIASGAVAGLAVDPKRHVARTIVLARRLVGDDLATVTALAICEPLHRAQDAERWPISAVRQGHVWSDGDPAPFGACARVAKPLRFVAGPVEGKEPDGPVGHPCHEPLGASPDHVAAADDAVDGKDPLLVPRLPDHELVLTLRRHARDHPTVREDDGASVEGRDDELRLRLAAGPAVGRGGPAVVVVLVALGARLRSDEVREAHAADRIRRGGREDA